MRATRCKFLIKFWFSVLSPRTLLSGSAARVGLLSLGIGTQNLNIVYYTCTMCRYYVSTAGYDFSPLLHFVFVFAFFEQKLIAKCGPNNRGN